MNVSTLTSRQDIPFVRIAKAGNWRTALQESTLEIIEKGLGPLMRLRR
jgi:hypothetical protein